MTGNPDYEAKGSYAFTVVATNATSNASEKAVTLAINNLDEVAPTITSGSTATAINENSGASQVIYTATSTDSGDTATGATTYSLKAATGDVSSFSINASTGAVTLTGNPDFEAKGSYAFTVVATDAANNAREKAVALAINNLDEVAPTITSGATATAINENSGATQVVYTATTTDSGDTATGATTYSLKAGSDAGLTINATTGAVTLTANPNFEAKSSYAFTVVATDAANNAREKAVALAINNLDEVAPTVTSAATATAINENSGASQVIYTATSADSGDTATGATTYSLKAATGDVSSFSINASTGAVTLTGNPDFEAKGSYAFTVVATNATSNASEKAVTLAINNLDEVAPTITSGSTASAINENSGATQVIYTATSTDTGDIATGATVYSLKAATGDVAAFSIDSSTGAVTLIANPNFEANGSYSFTVLASDGVNAATEKAVTLAINNLDEAAPTITSGSTATAINENSGAAQVVYTVTSTDTGDAASAGLSYSLKAGSDAALFSISASTGVVTLTGNPNFESKASYGFTVLASDGVNAATEKAMTLAITNLDEVAPTITSNATATAINENSGATQVVYAGTSTDTGDIATASTVYSLKAATGDASAFSINASTGAVTLTGNPDFETKASYKFTVVATDAANNASEKAVTLAIINIEEGTPVTPQPDPVLVLPPVTEWPSLPDNDGDGTPEALEDFVKPLNVTGAVAGDGNGDGVADAKQQSVASVPFLKTSTAISSPGNATPVFVSLVADSRDGKPDTTDGNTAQLQNVLQKNALTNLPAEVLMPLGLISFDAVVGLSATAGVGVTETFSLYVDSTIGVNGYWKQDTSGTWVNLASSVYGGAIVTEGGKTRLDFQVTDGGEFDADGQANGTIVDPGAAGFVPLSLVGYAPELPAGGFWF